MLLPLPSSSRRLHLLLYLLFASVALAFYSSWEHTGFESRFAHEGLVRALEDGVWSAGEGGNEVIPILMPVCARDPVRLGYFREVLQGLARMDRADEVSLGG